MSNAFISLMLGAGLSAWVYSQVYRRTGGNTQNSIVMAAIAGVLGAAVMFMALSAFLK